MTDRVPAGTAAAVVRKRSFVSSPRSLAVTGVSASAPVVPLPASLNVAVTANVSFSAPRPPRRAESVADTPPPSISVAAPPSSTVCTALDVSLSGPPAKNFWPPPMDAESAVSGPPNEPS
jgi:hypothetical protein